MNVTRESPRNTNGSPVSSEQPSGASTSQEVIGSPPVSTPIRAPTAKTSNKIHKQSNISAIDKKNESFEDIARNFLTKETKSSLWK